MPRSLKPSIVKERHDLIRERYQIREKLYHSHASTEATLRLARRLVKIDERMIETQTKI